MFAGRGRIFVYKKELENNSKWEEHWGQMCNAENYALEMNHIKKSFSGVVVLEQIDFRLQEGSVHALVGEIGAG